MTKPNHAAKSAQIAPFWEVLGERPIGFTVLTAAGDEPVGFVGLSVAHVSADPPLLSAALGPGNKAFGPIRRSGAFAVNFLSSRDDAIARTFMKKGASAAERFRPDDWETLATGSPTLSTAAGVFDCVVECVVELDHAKLLVGRVVASRTGKGGAPLVFFRGGLGVMAIQRSKDA